MSATEENFSSKRQEQLYKIRLLLFGCRKDWPKNTQSEYSLASTSKASQVADVPSRQLVTSSRSDILRLPAGGFAECGCSTSSGLLDTASNSTRNMSTQTGEDDDVYSENGSEFGEPQPNVSRRKDVATQSSFVWVPGGKTGAFIQVEYKNGPSTIVQEREDPPKDEASMSDNHKWKSSRPVIVVDGIGSSVSGASSKNPGNRQVTYADVPPKSPKPKNQNRMPARDPRYMDTKSQQQQNKKANAKTPISIIAPESGQRGNAKKPNTITPESGQRGDVKKPNTIAPESGQRGDVKNPNTIAPESGNQQQEGEVRSPTPTESSKKHQHTQHEGKTPPKEVGKKPSASEDIPELLKRVEELESKMKNQEQNLKSLQCSMMSCQVQEKEDSNCQPESPRPKECETPGKPECNDELTLSKEFIDIFMKPEATSQNKVCPCRSSQNMCIQYAEDSDMLLDQFKHLSAKSKPKESACKKNSKSKESITITCTIPKEQCPKKPEPKRGNSKNTKTDKAISLCLPMATPQCLREPETMTATNFLDKCVEMVARKPKNVEANIGNDSSPFSSAENNTPKSSDYGSQGMQKEVYDSLLAQFTRYSPQTKAECALKPPQPAQKTEGEQYSFERICAELANLLSKPRNQESYAAQEEDKLKRVTISDSNTILGEDHKASSHESMARQSNEEDVNPSEALKNISLSGHPVVSPGGCQSCSDNGNLPVLDSLVDELISLIGCRPFRDVVLTILRRGSNTYHLKVHEMATGHVLGCLLATGNAINEAIGLGVFDDIQTFCQLDIKRDCNVGSCLVAQRQPGGETQLATSGGTFRERAMAFATRVLSLPVGEAGHYFSLTNALKVAKKSSDQSIVGPQLAEDSNRTGLIGRGAVTGNLIFLGSVQDVSTTQSNPDLSELGEESRHFLQLLSGQDHEEDKL